jgi:hypothetical protein
MRITKVGVMYLTAEAQRRGGYAGEVFVTLRLMYLAVIHNFSGGLSAP